MMSFKLAASLSEEIDRLISARAVRKRLVEEGLKDCKGRKKPWLSEKKRKDRLQWALQHKHWTKQDWSNVLWSDESNFQVFITPDMTYVRCRPGEEYHPECVVPTIKHGGDSILAWGCMAGDGVGEIYICDGRMDSTKYTSVLETALLPSLTRIFADSNSENVKFQQDNAPCHKSAVTMRWFHENEVPLINWRQSPALNPTEHLWGMLKSENRGHNITSKESLKNALFHE